MVNRESEHNSILRLIHIGFLVGLIILLLMVLRPFITPLMWSVIFAILLHPIFIILNRKFNNRPSLTAFIITMLGFAFVLIVIIPLVANLGSEAFQVIKSLDQFDKDDFDALGLKAETIPIVGPAIKLYLLDTFNTNSNIWGDAIKVFQGYYLEFAKKTIASIASILFGAFFTFLCLYFVLAHSNTLIKQIKRGALIIGGQTYLEVITYIYDTIRATLYGVLLTSLAQGTLAGIAYYLISAPYPATLSIVTALASFLPFGPPFIYIPVAIGLFLNGVSLIKIVIFLIWGVGVVSLADNILRPLFISQTTKLSFLLVLFGIIGGVASFGMLGLFIGPIIMVVVIHFWGELLSKETLK